MGTDIVNNKVKELLGRFKDLPYDVQISKAIEHIDVQLREQPLIALLHEVKKELVKLKN
jgi:hypothetical protein